MAQVTLSLLKEFRQFLMRGNVVDLAVAVAVGAAFNNIVQSLVADVITPLLGAVVGKPDFSKLTFVINSSVFTYGKFLNALVSFLLISAAIFFFIVTPFNRFMRLVQMHETTPDPTTRKCPECISEIPMAATRCKFCTAVVPPEKGPEPAKMRRTKQKVAA